MFMCSLGRQSLPRSVTTLGDESWLLTSLGMKTFTSIHDLHTQYQQRAQSKCIIPPIIPELKSQIST